MIKRVTCLIYVATCLYKGRDDQFCYSINGCRLTEALKASLCRLQQRACPHSSCSLQWKNSLLLPENRKEKKKNPAFQKLKDICVIQYIGLHDADQHISPVYCVLFFLPAAHAKQVNVKAGMQECLHHSSTSSIIKFFIVLQILSYPQNKITYIFKLKKLYHLKLYHLK